jgi:arabinofuranan 3-O-arabinosyltransferase
VALLVVANLPPLWSGELVADNLQRDEDIPAYWPEVAAHLDRTGAGTRAVAVPGSDFASYRWGNTVDPVLPGLMDRPYAARELFQWGSAQSADLLNAWDRRFHEASMDPGSVAPIARLLGAGHLVVRNDLQYERYRIARPRPLWDLLSGAPGLGDVEGFGPREPNVAGPEQTLLDEVELAIPPDLEHPRAVEVVEVEDPLPIVRTRTAEHPVVLAGNGDGIVDASSMDLLGPNQAVFSSAWFAADPDGLATVAGRPGTDTAADLVVTDTNRRRAHRWGALREITGYTEEAGEEPLTYDPSDSRLEVHPDADDDDRTVTEQRRRDEPGIVTGATVRAADYGNPVTYTADDRPALALDGDPATAWRVGALDDVHGERLVIELDEPVTVDQVGLLQPVTLQRSRWITEVRLHFGDGTTLDVDLDESSRDESGAGQTVSFPERLVERLELEVLETNVGRMGRYEGLSGVGFAEVRIPGVGIEELVRPPVEPLAALGPSTLGHRLSFLLTRLRSNPAEPVRGDEEERMLRVLDVPSARSFSVRGQARISPFVADDVVDALVGLPDADAGGVTATSSHRLDGDLGSRASAAIDGDPTTAWSNGFQQQQGAFLRFRTAEPTTFDRLDLQVVADGRHSVPTRIRIEAATGEAEPEPVAAVDLPAIADGTEPGAVTTVPIRLERAVTADHLVVVVEEVRQVVTRDWYSNVRTVMPVALAELGIPGLALDPPTGEVDTGCRDDLAGLDGDALPLRVTGTVDAALARQALEVTACTTVDLAPGEHVLRTAPGRRTGIEVDRLLLASEAGGTALADDALPRIVPPGPRIELTADGRVVDEAVVEGADGPFWVVLAQSWSDGWTLEVDGVDQGTPVLADGFGNGWLVQPGDATDVSLRLEWRPQRVVWAALGLSALGGVAALALALGGRVRPRRHPAVASGPAAPSLPTLAHPLAPGPRVRTPLAWWALGAVVLAVAVNLPLALLWAVVPLTGLAVAALRWGRGASVAAAAAAASLGLAGLYIVVRQFRYRVRADFTWPSEFDRVHVLGLVAVLAVGIQFVRDLLGRLGAEEGPDDPDGPPPMGD